MKDGYDPEPSPLAIIAAFGVVVLAIAAGAILLLTNRPEPVQISIQPPAPTVTPMPSATPGPVTVYVTGAVAAPESLLELPPGSRIQDAIEAAGGMTENADMERVNLAGFVRDGDQVHVPEVGAALIVPTPGGLILINSATLDELTRLPGIGQVTAQAIIDYREANGPFASLEALDAVAGIGPATLAEIADMVSFD